MHNKAGNEVFDGVVKAAFNEYLDELLAEIPSDEELARMYPVSGRSLRKAKRHYKTQKYHRPLPLLYLQRAAVVILMIATVSFGVLLMSGDVRAAIRDAVVKWYDTYIRINFDNSEPSSEIKDADSLSIEYIPDGFELISKDESTGSRMYMYSSADGEYVMISIYSAESAEYFADTEFSEYEEIKIRNNPAYILYNEAEKGGSLFFGNDKYSVMLTGVLEKDQLIKIAENIK